MNSIYAVAFFVVVVLVVCILLSLWSISTTHKLLEDLKTTINRVNHAEDNITLLMRVKLGTTKRINGIDKSVQKLWDIVKSKQG